MAVLVPFLADDGAGLVVAQSEGGAVVAVQLAALPPSSRVTMPVRGSVSRRGCCSVMTTLPEDELKAWWFPLVKAWENRVAAFVVSSDCRQLWPPF
jgi:hypothetical protein